MASPATPPDYYALLGVPRTADAEEIRTAYRVLAKQHHPDLADASTSPSTDRFLQIQEAYNVLRHVARRAQYDLECQRREAMAAQQAQWPITPGSRVAVRPAAAPPPPPFGRPYPRARAPGVWLLAGAVVVVIAAAAVVIFQQRAANLAARERAAVAVVKVEPSRQPLSLPQETKRTSRDGGGLPPDLTALGREFTALSRQQADRAEARKAEAEAKRTAAAQPPPVAPTEPAAGDARSRKIVCRGGGRTLTVVHDNDVVSLSYNGGPMVHPTVKETMAGMVVVSAFEPTNLVSIGFMKGDKDRTVLIITDAAGNVFSSIGVDCTAAAF